MWVEVPCPGESLPRGLGSRSHACTCMQICRAGRAQDQTLPHLWKCFHMFPPTHLTPGCILSLRHFFLSLHFSPMKQHSHVYTYKSLIYSPCKNPMLRWKAGTSDTAAREERKWLCRMCTPWLPPPCSHLSFLQLSWINMFVPSMGLMILPLN